MKLAMLSSENKYRLALFLMGLTSVWVLLPKCSTDPKPTANNHDSIYKAEKKQDIKIKQAVHKDSVLTVTKIKYVVRYKTVYDSLFINDTTCQQSLITLYNAFGDLNTANDSLLSNKDTIIKALVYKIGLKQSHITVDSTRLVQLIDTLPKVKRKGFWSGFKFGFASGVILTEGVNLSIKLKP